MKENQNRTVKGGVRKSDWVPFIYNKVQSLQRGRVEIVVHDSGVTQLVIKENVPLDKQITINEPIQNNTSPT
jgi:hypothetical protein